MPRQSKMTQDYCTVFIYFDIFSSKKTVNNLKKTASQTTQRFTQEFHGFNDRFQKRVFKFSKAEISNEHFLLFLSVTKYFEIARLNYYYYCFFPVSSNF